MGILKKLVLALGLLGIVSGISMVHADDDDDHGKGRWQCQAVCHVGIAHRDPKGKLGAPFDVAGSLTSEGRNPVLAWRNLEMQCEVFAYSPYVREMPIDGVLDTNVIVSIAFPGSSMAQACLKL